MTRRQANSFRAAIVTQRTAADDQIAARSAEVYDTWERLAEIKYTAKKAGYRFRYCDKIYKTVQPNHTFSAEWTPGIGTESIYEVINVEHSGASDDPIPYDGNMVLIRGMYYTQGGKVYYCTRDTISAVYNPLSELVGIYVEEV